MISREFATPIHKAPKLSADLAIDLWVKRDDLLPMAGGGNKVRKVAAILGGPEAVGTTALVTTGGVHSNHARVVALCAAQRGWRCHLVLHGSPADANPAQGNLLLMKLAGASVNIVDAEAIGPALEHAVGQLRQQGEEPLLIPGGAHTAAGALAYADALREVAEQLAEWVPDFIVLASGTGGTQAGILFGCERMGWTTRVIGVSVARRAERGHKIVHESYRELRRRIPDDVPELPVDFRDEWVGAGYGKADDRVFETIRRVARQEGLLLDPTYTGKAFLGLIDMVTSGIVEPGSRVLFWHTGGLLNLVNVQGIESLDVVDRGNWPR